MGSTALEPQFCWSCPLALTEIHKPGQAWWGGGVTAKELSSGGQGKWWAPRWEFAQCLLGALWVSSKESEWPSGQSDLGDGPVIAGRSQARVSDSPVTDLSPYPQFCSHHQQPTRPLPLLPDELSSAWGLGSGSTPKW